MSEGKIDAAYADGYNQSLLETQNETNRVHRYDEANQAGQLAEVETVESVTGVHIDHFIVSNIIGFYELASQFGGLEVCIKPAPAQGGFSKGANLSDYDPRTGTDNSGFNAVADGYNRAKGGPQYLHLYASQALAYVRSRDTLPGVDVGRTARQQAAMGYIVWKLEHGNILGSLSAITTLLNNAQGYLEYDSGWNLLDFAQGMNSLTSSGLHFTTLPEASVNNVYVPSLGSRQSVDLIDTTMLQQQVNEAFYGQPAIPATARTETVDVYNGGSTTHLATDVRSDLVALGYKAGQAAPPASQSQAVTGATQVFYGGGPDDQANAKAIANLVGEATGPASLSSLPAGHIEVLLGKNVGQTPPGLLLTGWDYITPATWISDATGNSQKIPPNMTAAATAAASGRSVRRVPVRHRPRRRRLRVGRPGQSGHRHRARQGPVGEDFRARHGDAHRALVLGAGRRAGRRRPDDPRPLRHLRLPLLTGAGRRHHKVAPPGFLATPPRKVAEGISPCGIRPSPDQYLTGTTPGGTRWKPSKKLVTSCCEKM